MHGDRVVANVVSQGAALAFERERELRLTLAAAAAADAPCADALGPHGLVPEELRRAAAGCGPGAEGEPR